MLGQVSGPTPRGMTGDAPKKEARGRTSGILQEKGMDDWDRLPLSAEALPRLSTGVRDQRAWLAAVQGL